MKENKMKTAKRIRTRKEKVTIKDDRVLNAFESKGRQHDFVMSEPTEPIDNLPSKYDCRRKVSSRWGKVFNQGQTGSCVGQAAAKQRHFHLLKDKKIPNSRERYIPSVKYLWQAPKEFDVWDVYPSTMLLQSGTYIKSSLDIQRKHGCPPRS